MTNSSNPKRDALIEKIRKLSKMTQANGASESEAAMAAKTMSRLIEEYNISSSELEVRADANGCIKDSFSAMRGMDIWTDGCWDIGELFHCKVWRSKGNMELMDDLELPSIEMNFYGFPQDVEAAVSLCRIIYIAVQHATISFTKSTGLRKSKARDLKIESFALGMAQRLRERVRELIPPPVLSQGRGLMVLKDQLVTDKFAEYCRLNGLTFGHARERRIADPNAYHAGRAAGANVDLQRSGKVSRSHYHIGKA
jgi:hypothetical protein